MYMYIYMYIHVYVHYIIIDYMVLITVASSKILEQSAPICLITGTELMADIIGECRLNGR